MPIFVDLEKNFRSLFGIFAIKVSFKLSNTDTLLVRFILSRHLLVSTGTWISQKRWKYNNVFMLVTEKRYKMFSLQIIYRITSCQQNWIPIFFLWTLLWLRLFQQLSIILFNFYFENRLQKPTGSWGAVLNIVTSK